MKDLHRILLLNIYFFGVFDFRANNHFFRYSFPFHFYREGYIYYSKTQAHPNYIGKYTTSSLLDLITWDAADNLDLIEQQLTQKIKSYFS